MNRGVFVQRLIDYMQAAHPSARAQEATIRGMSGPMDPTEYLQAYDDALANYDYVLANADLTAEQRATAQENRDATAASRAEAEERLNVDPAVGG